MVDRIQLIILKENKTKSESENGKEKNGVVYLTDDDINDLIK